VDESGVGRYVRNTLMEMSLTIAKGRMSTRFPDAVPNQTSTILNTIGDIQNTVDDPMNTNFSARISKRNTEVEELCNEAKALELEFGEEKKEEELPIDNHFEGLMEIQNDGQLLVKEPEVEGTNPDG